MKTIAKIKFSTAVAVAAGGLLVGTALAAGNTLYVSNAGCSASGPGDQAHPYCTIQQAVDAANAGDTIKVDKGSYTDPVNVNKSLTLLGAQANKTAVSDRTNPANETVVNTGGVDGVTLTADNITLKGFSFSGNAAGPGVTTSADHRGYIIMNDIFSNNVFGLYLNSNGATASEVSRNRFDGNNQAGAAAGNAIYSDQGAKNIKIHHNLFKNQTNAAMTFVAGSATASQQDLQMDHNQFNGPGAMLILVNGQRISFDHNDGTGFNGQSAVFLGGSDSNIKINHNNLTGDVDTNTGTKNGFSGIRINLDQASYGTFLTLVANDAVTVDHNTIKNFGDAGISIGNGDGVTSTLTNSQIDHNMATGNGDVDAAFDAGILIRNGNTGLEIDHNLLKNNLLFDAVDNNTTVNDWHNNLCQTSNPNGLCS